MHHNHHLHACLFALTLLLSACAASPLARLDQAEKQWRSAAPQSYTIAVLEVNSIWHAQTNRIEVVDGQVVGSSATCVRAPMETKACEIREFAPANYTVPGLFERARARLRGQEARYVEISYDPALGYPATISYDDPQAVDEEWGLRVTEFEVVK